MSILDELKAAESEILTRRVEAQRKGNAELFERLSEESIEVRKQILAIEPKEPIVRNDPTEWKKFTEWRAGWN